MYTLKHPNHQSDHDTKESHLHRAPDQTSRALSTRGKGRREKAEQNQDGLGTVCPQG